MKFEDIKDFLNKVKDIVEDNKESSFEDVFTGGLINWNTGISRKFIYPKSGDETDRLYVQRRLINAIGALGLNEALFRSSGGIHTYNQDIAEHYIDPDGSQVVGYPYGAILDWLDNSGGDHPRWVRKIRCIKEVDGIKGNCTTSPDNQDHGVYSEDPYWEICDAFENTQYSKSLSFYKTEDVPYNTSSSMSLPESSIIVTSGTGKNDILSKNGVTANLNTVRFFSTSNSIDIEIASGCAIPIEKRSDMNVQNNFNATVQLKYYKLEDVNANS